jgi:hypothetical protein
VSIAELYAAAVSPCSSDVETLGQSMVSRLGVSVLVVAEPRWRTLFLVAVTALVGLVGSAASAASARPVVRPAARAISALGPKNRAVMSKVRRLVSGPIGNGLFVHFWTAPTPRGGRCYFETIDNSRTARQSSLSWPPTGGGGCSIGHASPISPHGLTAHPFQHLSVGVQTRSAEHANWIPPYVQGEIVTTAVPARVVVRWRGGSHALALEGRFFAGGTPSMYPHTRELTLFAYDREGRAIARTAVLSPPQ